MTEMEDFGDVGAIQQTGDGALYWDALLSDLLTELEAISIGTAHIQNATLSADRPRRFASGTPIFIDQFEYGDGLWTGTNSGTDGSSARSDTSYMSKGYSWELKSATDSTHRASMQMKIGAIEQGPVGLQFAFTFHSYTDYYEAEFYLKGPAASYVPEVKIDYNNSRIQILDEDSVFQTVLEWTSMASAATFFVFLKVTLDTLTGLWDTLYFNSEEVDISAYGVPSATAEDNGSLWVRVNHFGEDTRNPIVYVDDFCITLED